MTLIKLSTPKAKLLFGALAIALLISAVWAFRRAQDNRLIAQAELQVKAGLGALATETLEPRRHRIATTRQGCEVLTATYLQARRADRLEWASQACIFAEQDSLGVWLGLASARELQGRDDEAVQVLGAAAKRYPQAPEPVYSTALILKRNKREKDSTGLFLRAAEMAPKNAQFGLAVLQQLASMNQWSEARLLAQRLATAETQDPEVKLFIARALLKAGETKSAKDLAAQASVIMPQDAQSRAALERAYAELFTDGSRDVASAEPHKPTASKR